MESIDTLREILTNMEHNLDVHLDLNHYLELQYANDLKEHELGTIDENEFNQRKNGHYYAVEQLRQKRNRK